VERKYVLGIDIGIASIGWATFNLDEHGNPVEFCHMGSFCYPNPISEIVKGRRVTSRTGRGAKRRQRHRLEHFKARRKKLTRLLVDLGWLPTDPDEQTALRCRKTRRVDGNVELEHPIALKVKALSAPLEPYQLGKILLHYQRHRGYLSTADLPVLLAFKGPKVAKVEVVKADVPLELETSEEKETRVLNASLKATREHLDGRTVSQFQLAELEKHQAVRAVKRPKVAKELPKDERDAVKRQQKPATPFRYDRWMYVKEFDRIWEVQRAHYPQMTEELWRTLRDLMFHQNPLKSTKGLVGKCQVLPDRRRCPRADLAFQRFNIAQYLANLEVNEGGHRRTLTQAEREAALPALVSVEQMSWPRLKEVCGIAADAVFSREPEEGLELAPKKKKGEKRPKKTARSVQAEVKGSPVGAFLAKTIGATGQDLVSGRHDGIIEDRLAEMHLDPLYQRLTKFHGLSHEQALAVIEYEPPKGYASYCRRVLRQVLPHLLSQTDRKGKDSHVDKALLAAGYGRVKPMAESPSRLKLDKKYNTGNPSVDAAVSWSVKVINQIMDHYEGPPSVIRIELPRIMALGNEARAEKWLEIQRNEKNNAAIRQELAAAKRDPSDRNVRLVKLWREAGNRCPYEPDRPIDSIASLVDNYEIDHIIPKSVFAEDAYGNNTICPTRLNQQKGGRTPYQAFGATDPIRWNRIQAYVKGLSGMDKRKRDRLLDENDPEMAMEKRMEPTVGYVGRKMAALLGTLGAQVTFVKGTMVATVRGLYGLNSLLEKPEKPLKRGMGVSEEYRDEKNREDLRHHALDAAVIALLDVSMAQRLTRYHKAKEAQKRGEGGAAAEGHRVKIQLEEPFPNLRRVLEEALKNCPVVSPPDRKVAGPLHEETRIAKSAFPAISGPPDTVREHGSLVVHFGPDGKPCAAWARGEIHHGFIFERRTKKGSERGVVSVSRFTVAQRQAFNERLKRRRKQGKDLDVPFRRIIDPAADLPPGATLVMSLSGKDLVIYKGEKGAGPGWYRIGTIAVGAKSTELVLLWHRAAMSAPKAPTSIRVTGQKELHNVVARVLLNVFGVEVFREPAADNEANRGDPDTGLFAPG
jgi:CRISPR-associated endonuclease Csn1